MYDLYQEAPNFRQFLKYTELRGVEQDNIPLSPYKDRRVFGINFVWKNDFENVYK